MEWALIYCRCFFQGESLTLFVVQGTSLIVFVVQGLSVILFVVQGVSLTLSLSKALALGALSDTKLTSARISQSVELYLFYRKGWKHWPPASKQALPLSKIFLCTRQIFSLEILAKLFQIFKFLQGIWIDFAFCSVSCLNCGVSVSLT
jgi:hypothetical protein